MTTALDGHIELDRHINETVRAADAMRRAAGRQPTREQLLARRATRDGAGHVSLD